MARLKKSRKEQEAVLADVRIVQPVLRFGACGSKAPIPITSAQALASLKNAFPNFS